jgi:hypothetical protein
MRSWICIVLSVFVLVAGLAWSSDGHALTGEEHDHEASFSIQIDDQDDDRHADPSCDHHCHAGAHLIALPAGGMSEFAPSLGSLSGQPSPGINLLHKESPYRPPSS